MKGMTVIVKTIASWVKVLIFLFGLYIIIFGHLTPGGGFSGGVILASWARAGDRDTRPFSRMVSKARLCP